MEQVLNCKIIFLPWYSIVNKTVIGNYTLYPFDFSLKNNDSDLKHLESDIKIILKNYVNRPYTNACTREFPTTQATIIKHNGRNIEDDFLPKESEELYLLQYIISTCGISERTFVRDDLYLSSENLKIYIQPFQAPLGESFSPFISNKRKKGRSGVGFSEGMFREVKPYSIPTQQIPGNKDYRLKFDTELACALWKVWKSRNFQKHWNQKISHSLFSFYLANADAYSRQVECIYSESCIEKLLLGNKHKESELLRSFQELMVKSNIKFEKYNGLRSRNWRSIKVNKWRKRYECIRKTTNKNILKNKTARIFKLIKKTQVQVSLPSILDAWLIELKRLRNTYAHGGFADPSKSVWSLNEHLMFSSFIYPLLLKLYLVITVEIDDYILNKDEMNKLKVLEQLLHCKDLDKVDHSTQTEWEKTISDSKWL